MSEYYQTLDKGHFDYSLVRLPGLPIVVRGPKVDFSKPYFACAGAAQTFGRFCHRPFPELVGEEIGRQVLNLGIGGAGPAFFDRPPIVELLNRADFVVFQVLSGRSEGNRFFDNSASKGVFGISRLNFKRMRFEMFLEDIVERWAWGPVRAVIEETRERYVAHATGLLDKIHRPKVLLWISQRNPNYAEDYSSASGILGGFPQLVNRDMLESLREHVDEFVDCTSRAGLPQELWSAAKPIDGAYFDRGKLFNDYYPSPEIHRLAAERLVPVCRRLKHSSEPSTAAVGKPRRPTSPAERFTILGAERSGTGLVRQLLASHPGVCVGGELFNRILIRQSEIDWPVGAGLERDELNALRVSDPKAFIDLLFEMSKTSLRRTFGFRLMYSHADKDSRVRDFLASDHSFRIIHVKRRNLLRRLVSFQRALKTDRWHVRISDPPPSYPRVTLSADSCIADFSLIECKRAQYEDYFKDHKMLELYYEDVCADLPGTRSRILAFLGLPDVGSLVISSQKGGVDSLREAIENYDDIRAALPDRAEFFDD